MYEDGRNFKEFSAMKIVCQTKILGTAWSLIFMRNSKNQNDIWEKETSDLLYKITKQKKCDFVEEMQ